MEQIQSLGGTKEAEVLSGELPHVQFVPVPCGVHYKECGHVHENGGRGSSGAPEAPLCVPYGHTGN